MTDSPEHHRQRSEFIRGMVQRTECALAGRSLREQPPKTIIQFWHDLQNLPPDVEECIASWARWQEVGFKHVLFDEFTARSYIRTSLGRRYEQAFDRCYHPAMQADYFRLCYLSVEGGFYVDADDVCIGSHIDWLFEDTRLKVHPLCYDIATASMVSTASFLTAETFTPNWIFYFNNNPLIAARRHPVIQLALQRSTEALENSIDGALPEIQATTGPGILSRTIFELGVTSGTIEREVVVLRDWDLFAISKWPLSYRNDRRNWRHSNQKAI
ncbi:glycosyltransferase family 32 protein [Bradyrhizobium zhanjiangense]|nr:glycosyltransferase [Bradyrhizobium zhanjiangense]